MTEGRKKGSKNEGTAIVSVIDTNLCQKVTKKKGRGITEELELPHAEVN